MSAAKSDAIDLTRWLGEKDDLRGFGAPFLIDGRTAAINGHVLLILDRAAPEVEECVLSTSLTSNLRAMISRLLNESRETCGWVPAETVTTKSIDKCDDCQGRGHAARTDCDDCDGDGDFWHGRHNYTCEECKGEGELIEPAGSEAPLCRRCRGAGFRGEFTALPGCTRHGINSNYLHMVQALPDANLRIIPDVIDQGTVIPFRFTGGFGGVMPLRGNSHFDIPSDATAGGEA